MNESLLLWCSFTLTQNNLKRFFITNVKILQSKHFMCFSMIMFRSDRCGRGLGNCNSTFRPGRMMEGFVIPTFRPTRLSAFTRGYFPRQLPLRKIFLPPSSDLFSVIESKLSEGYEGLYKMKEGMKYISEILREITTTFEEL